MRLARVLALLGLLVLTAPSALALDCTPFHVSTGPDQGYLDTFANTPGQPGEVVCGHDFTGWTLFVIEFTVNSPGIGYLTALAQNGFTGFAGCNTVAYQQISQDHGLQCVQCDVVGLDLSSWSVLKGQYRD